MRIHFVSYLLESIFYFLCCYFIICNLQFENTYVYPLNESESPVRHLPDQQLCDLNRVRRCALANLVAAAPEVNTVLVDEVTSDPADKYVVLIACFDRHRISLVRRVVNKLAALLISDRLTNDIEVKIVFGNNDRRD